MILKIAIVSFTLVILFTFVIIVGVGHYINVVGFHGCLGFGDSGITSKNDINRNDRLKVYLKISIKPE